jgi:hypothetical protein
VVIIGAAWTGFRIAATDHRDVDDIGWQTTSQRVAHQRSAERWRIEGAFTEGGVHTTMPPLVDGQETEMWQAVCGSATTGGIDHLEERVPTMTEAPVNTTTKLL